MTRYKNNSIPRGQFGNRLDTKAGRAKEEQMVNARLATYNPSGVMDGYTPPTLPGRPTDTAPTGPSAGDLAQQRYYEQMAKAAQDAKDNALNQNLASSKAMIDSYGMGELWSGVDKLLRSGYTDFDTINMMLSQDSAYQTQYYKRFPAVKTIREMNASRTSSGLPPIAEPTAKGYVALEKAYRQALTGLPSGSFGDATDIAGWIVKDVSPTEVADRVTSAKNYVYYSANGEIKTQLRKIYGMTDGEMAAYVLSPDRALTQIQNEYQRKLAQATVGGAASASGLTLNDLTRDSIAENEQFGNSYANTLAQMNDVREIDGAYARLGRLSGVRTETDELVNEQFGLAGAAAITEKKKNLASQERARFSGSSGIGKGSLSAGRLAQ